MGIGATKAVQDRLKTTKIEESKSASLVFCWDTHLTKIKGRNVLFIVNASNRYTIAMTDIEPRNWNYYTMYIRSVIHGVMQEMGYSEEQIGQYFKMSGDTTVTKTHGRKSVGGINRMVMDAQYFGKKLEKEAKYQWELSEYLNRDICQPEGFDAYGVKSEFEIAKEKNNILIPVGCTGFMTKKLWDDVNSDLQKYYGEVDSCVVEKFKKLNEQMPIGDMVQNIINLINELRRK